MLHSNRLFSVRLRTFKVSIKTDIVTYSIKKFILAQWQFNLLDKFIKDLVYGVFGTTYTKYICLYAQGRKGVFYNLYFLTLTIIITSKDPRTMPIQINT